MEIEITTTRPEWAKGRGTVHDVRFLYTGRGRINTHSRTYQAIQRDSSGIHLFERPFLGGVVSRVYNAEYSTMTVYSTNPRRWSEETMGATEYFAEVRRNKH